MEALKRNTEVLLQKRPIRVLQFGGGNFLRAFSDWMIEILNEKTDFNGDVLVIKPTKRGDYKSLREQEGLFHVLLNGVEKGDVIEQIKLISCIQQIIHPYTDWGNFIASAQISDLRFIISNTTESGIVYSPGEAKPVQACPKEFPAKLCYWLWARYEHFKGAEDKGCMILPLELIEQNGAKLKKNLLSYATDWELGEGFVNWINQHNYFCDTLVDRIVSGYPLEKVNEIQTQLQVEDQLLVAGEIYHSWIIKGPAHLEKELPFAQTELNIQLVEELDIHRQIKVRLLNGAHTSLVPIGLLAGLELVSEAIAHPLLSIYLKGLFEKEVIPHIEYDKAYLKGFAEDVIDRFKNPHIKHQLISISLNSTSKFVSRLLGSFKDYLQNKEALPVHICFAWAALICLYRGEWKGKTF
ncbi:MAG: tagaturonate reductase, partial [Bacteroidota bacterium]